MLAQILSTLVRLLFPKAPEWVARFVGLALPAIFEVIDELSTTDLEGQDKFKLAVHEIAGVMDEAFDEIPRWSELSEARRDLVLGGLVELAVFMQGLTEGSDPVKNRALRRSVRRAVKDLKRGLA